MRTFSSTSNVRCWRTLPVTVKPSLKITKASSATWASATAGTQRPRVASKMRIVMGVLPRADSDSGDAARRFASSPGSDETAERRSTCHSRLVLFSPLPVGGQVTVERTGETRENGILAQNFRGVSKKGSDPFAFEKLFAEHVDCDRRGSDPFLDTRKTRETVFQARLGLTTGGSPQGQGTMPIRFR